MNTILQKRIEEKSKGLAHKYFPNEMNIWARPNYEAQYVESACKEIATFALQNQWISVEEALPIIGKDGYVDVFIIIKKNKKTLTYTARFEDNKFWNIDGFGVYQGVTHWMEIPSLKGGEK